MTEHAAAAAHPPTESHSLASHEPHDPHDHHNDPESIAKEKKRYLMVFGALGVLTAITVGVAQLHLPAWETILLALSIATIKGTLVAAFFMHLLSERKLIYGVLILTVAFFFVLMFAPLHHREDAKGTWPNYDHTNKPADATSTAAATHGGH